MEMSKPVDELATRGAITVLLEQGVLTWQALEPIAFELSRRGFDRARIVEFFSTLLRESSDRLAEEDADFVGDFLLHLIGQCNAKEIVRLAGDPEGVEALAEYVCSGRWKHPPPT